MSHTSLARKPWSGRWRTVDGHGDGLVAAQLSSCTDET
jgi:hypothetical protein